MTQPIRPKYSALYTRAVAAKSIGNEKSVIPILIIKAKTVNEGKELLFRGRLAWTYSQYPDNGRAGQIPKAKTPDNCSIIQ
jgi:hypothetical protein